MRIAPDPLRIRRNLNGKKHGARMKMNTTPELLNHGIRQVDGQAQICRMAREFKLINGASLGFCFATSKTFGKKGLDDVFSNFRRKDTPDPAVKELGRNLTAAQRNLAIQIGD